MAIRRFVDQAGTHWEAFRVRWRSPDLASASPEGGWLTFVSPTEKRRIASFPMDWDSLPDGALELLCDKAERVQRVDPNEAAGREVPNADQESSQASTRPDHTSPRAHPRIKDPTSRDGADVKDAIMS